MRLLEETIRQIRPLDTAAGKRVRMRLDTLTKPRGSLGMLEDLVSRYAEIRQDVDAAPGPAEIAVVTADHGIADEGVSAYPRAVTVEMLRNIARGGAAISVLARHFGFALRLYDLGVESDTRSENLPCVEYRRIAAGTRNFCHESAMSPEQARGRDARYW